MGASSSKRNSLEEQTPFNRNTFRENNLLPVVPIVQRQPVSQLHQASQHQHQHQQQLQIQQPSKTTKIELPKSYELWNKAYVDHRVKPIHLDQFYSRIAERTEISREYLRKADELKLTRDRKEAELFNKQETIKPPSSILSCVSLVTKIDAFRKAHLKYYPTPQKRLPELTPEILDTVQQALKPQPAKEALVEIDNVPILRQDIKTLDGLNWLNDEIVNAYLSLIVKRSMNTDKKVYHFNTFFYPKIRDTSYASVKRWTRRVDIFSYSFILVPVHLGNHWCLAVIDFTKRTISYYDSLGGRSNGCCDTLLDYLRNESLDKKKQDFDDENWRLIDAYYEGEGIPQQENYADCGVFLCTYAEFLTRQSKLNFSQQQMPYFRKKIIYEIISNKIMDM